MIAILYHISCTNMNYPKLTAEQLKIINEHYKKWQFDNISFNQDSMINYGILYRNNIPPKNRKLLIYIDGSHNRSAFGIKQGDEWIEAGTPSSYGISLFKDYDILVPEKINIEIGKDHKDDKNVYFYNTVEYKVESAKMVIDKFLNNSNYSLIIMIGASEGGGILAKLYNSLDYKHKISKIIILFCGIGLSQYEDFKILQKSDLNIPANLKAGYDNIDKEIPKIKQDPDSIAKWYFGHPYKRWASFLFYNPAIDLIKIEIPILVINGMLDYNTAAESSKPIIQKFNELEKHNLSYITYKDMGHGPANQEQAIKMYEDIIDWVGN